MEKQEIYLLQGIFFYHGFAGFGIGFDPGIGERVTVETETQYDMFNGIVSFRKDNSYKLGGVMSDRFGDSELTDIAVSKDIFYFTKRYLKTISSPKPIFYEFKRKNEQGIWQGRYKGESTGEGSAQCIINVVDEDFFLPCSLNIDAKPK